MSASDPVGDMFAMMKNGLQRRKPKISLSHSRMKESVCRVLKEEGYIEDVQTVEDEKLGKKGRRLHVYLRYDAEGVSVIRGLHRVSRPGCRVYRGVRNLGKVLDGLGITVLSTPRGIVSDRKARREKLGGEVICKVW